MILSFLLTIGYSSRYDTEPSQILRPGGALSKPYAKHFDQSQQLFEVYLVCQTQQSFPFFDIRDDFLAFVRISVLYHYYVFVEDRFRVTTTTSTTTTTTTSTHTTNTNTTTITFATTYTLLNSPVFLCRMD